jgi:hypothetical protein
VMQMFDTCHWLGMNAILLAVLKICMEPATLPHTTLLIHLFVYVTISLYLSLSL